MGHSVDYESWRKQRTAAAKPADAMLRVIPRTAGPRIATARGSVVHSIRPRGEQTFRTVEYCAAVMLAPSPQMEGAFASDRMHRFDAQVGSLVISPAEIESRSVWQSVRENITIALPSKTMLQLAEHELDRGDLRLHPIPFGTVDQKALSFAQMLKAELSRAEAVNELYVDALITLFGIHVLRTYAGNSKPPKSAKGSLPQHKAKRVREYLHANFREKVSIAELAAVCDLSPGYFIHAFAETFAVSPHRYLINLRLAAAERLLVESDLSIAAIAYANGFSSQSHLTSTMRKYKNLTPAQLRVAK
ncbi:helix-turn-helix transcriptional regulator [Microvirga sp. 3-52]|nr:helix-turn-helix transcriptional regulator [Microvirga sp. 3-52]